MRNSSPATQSSEPSESSPRNPEAAVTDWLSYATDACQRTALVLDTMRKRGNAYKEHLEQGTPPLLKFDHELVLDGRMLSRPCNYALLRIVPGAEIPADPTARPVIVVDPRAGHGPGIGGFKMDSEVGVAMRTGHPVYFITFRPEPENGQTLADVMHAEARFIDEVKQRHPHSANKPVIIGNCQAGGPSRDSQRSTLRWPVHSCWSARPSRTGPAARSSIRCGIAAPLSEERGSPRSAPIWGQVNSTARTSSRTSKN